MKRITASILCVSAILCLCSCTAQSLTTSKPAATEPSAETSTTTDAFGGQIPDLTFELEKVGRASAYNFHYYRDTTTDLLFLKSPNGLTAIWDPETGLPMTYTRYIELSKQS